MKNRKHTDNLYHLLSLLPCNFLKKGVVIMNNSIKKKMLSATASLIHATTVKNVNSACVVIWGQPKEPSTLKRFKKTNR